MKTHGEVGRRSPARVALSIVAIALAAWALMAIWPKSGAGAQPRWRARPNGALLVMAHQAGAMERPSESNLAFEHAAAIGVDVFELDVALSADGILAVIHDGTLDRTTDGAGPVRSKTYAEIRFLDAGYGLLGADGEPIRDASRNPYIGIGAYVPSLEELFRTYPDMPMLVEIKDDGPVGALAAAELRRLIDAYGRADRTLVASFSEASMKAFKALPGPKPIYAASKPEMTRFYAFHMLKLNALNNDTDFKALSLPLSSTIGPYTADLRSEALRGDVARRGLAAFYWTINDSDDMRMLVDLAASGPNSGVDGVITDRPSELLAILKERGLR